MDSGRFPLNERLDRHWTQPRNRDQGNQLGETLISGRTEGGDSRPGTRKEKGIRDGRSPDPDQDEDDETGSRRSSLLSPCRSTTFGERGSFPR